jgi:ATP-dependent helicase HepA
VDTFIPGQRWISSTELQMGLGTVMAVDHRTVTIVFLATGETRIYAQATAPLSRVRFAPGDEILSHEGWHMIVESVTEQNGLLHYHGTRGDDGSAAQMEEGELNNFIQLSRPSDRLFTGQIDANKWFELRYQALQHLNRLSHSDLRGLTGGRTSLIPHQLYIAHEVANRYAPRVLLADEVGLGKTIEAGLILHHQLLTERVQRVLIVVPETLVHQWLVEMLRRFNLAFSIFDEERCLATDESSGQDNPFDSEQLVLCNLGFLVNHPERFEQARSADWDLLIVDEAHHLQWTPQSSSREYTVVEQLAAVTQGVLLLTATPEQLGKLSHFARLRLLDPDRFGDFDRFVEEEQHYEPVARAVEELLSETPLSKDALATLMDTIDEGDNRSLLECLQQTETTDESAQTLVRARAQLVEHLLDRHGTGRVLFRNTRAAVKGFPPRQLTAYPLPLPELYAECIAEHQATGVTNAQLMLSPELLYQSLRSDQQIPWHQIDPRIDWLSNTLKQLKPNKVLVITSDARSALDIAEVLRIKQGIYAAVFHEGLSIIERDRAAAYFADTEAGTQVLVCSEIGSEGRNFQFAHHLVLFDLPLNPDLLEQRIGRLDRIGQQHTIEIHVPYLETSAQAIMYHWYHQGLSAFEHTCPAGHSVFVQVQETLMQALHQTDEGLADLPALINTSKQLHDELNQALHRGRDRLLEYNSCRPQIANTLQQRAHEQDTENLLPGFMENVFDCYGIELEEDTTQSSILRPSEHMQSSSFPSLDPEGMTITYDRDTALAYEDMHFLSWEHPMVTGVLDMLLSDEQGNTAVTAIKYKELQPGTLLLESIYLLDTPSHDALQSSRFLPPTSIRIVLDSKKKNHAETLTHERIKRSQITLNKEMTKKVVRSQAQAIRDMISICDDMARQQAPQILAQAQRDISSVLQREIDRLIALRQVNPNVRENEIRYFEGQLNALVQVLEASKPRLEALRVIVVT